MIEAARTLGFAARFITGYIYVPDRDGPTWLGGGATHAWCQIYVPGSGWVEFDPTNGIVGNRDLIRVAVARVPSQAIPLFGTYWGDREDELGMNVEVNVKTAALISSYCSTRRKEPKHRQRIGDYESLRVAIAYTRSKRSSRSKSNLEDAE